MSILIYKNEEQEGPYSIEIIQAGLQSGRFGPDDFAYTDGCTDWVALHTLMPASSSPPSLPKTSIASKVESKIERLDSAIAKLVSDEQDPAVVEKIMKKARELLTRGEEVEYVGVQKKPVVTIAPDAVLLTNKRFMIVRPKLMGMTFDDHLWREVANVHMSEQMLSATITCQIVGGKTLSIESIPKKQARKIYSYAQEIEERMHDERRNREMEERRATAGGVVIQAPAQMPVQQVMVQPDLKEDPIEVLGKLKKMLDAGLIEQFEFDAKKAEILAKM
jgi:hypothetical protein